MSVCAILYLCAPHLPEDDAFITFRYALNARAGNGLIYNVGERVCGVSSPFYLLFVTILSSLFRASAIDEIVR